MERPNWKDKGSFSTINYSWILASYLYYLYNNTFSTNINFSYVRKEVADLIYFLGAGIDGGLKAIKESDKNHIKVLTVDQSEYTISSLQDGSVTASIVQHPYTQGLKSIEYITCIL